MGAQLRSTTRNNHYIRALNEAYYSLAQTTSSQSWLSTSLLSFSSPTSPFLLNRKNSLGLITTAKTGGKNDVVGRERRRNGIVVASSNVGAAPFWDGWTPEKASSAPSLSDILWPSAGAFAAMALLGKMDQILAPKGVSMTIAPLGAVCAVLFATPSSPGAKKYNMFMAQIGCAAIGVLAFSIFGPGWLARSSALAASIAFMIFTRSTHPPAASLPILFIDGAKLHSLNFWYALFPGAAGCVLLCLIQEVVVYLRNNLKF
ncbi:uncharacterized protein LOC21393410 isoform X1 [Morus notabilis]|uniref:uncharacterized protein LOC21393410 isoform X1 n=1 Tax=Morus notabilis TaxID=981085 RepID=UPI000CED47B6|nr:uncharacterized protein LOC21393410 isoform X1 [Morus notabilis]